MQLSTKSRYATRLLLAMAIRGEGEPLRAAALSSNTGISVQYIEKIIQPLREAGIITSKRGPAGGYSLNRKPEEISLAEIVRLLEGGVHLTCCCDNPERCSMFDECRNRTVWGRINKLMEQELKEITLAGLMGTPSSQLPDGCTK